MRTILFLCFATLGSLSLPMMDARAGEQEVKNKSEREIDKTFENDAEFRVDDQSALSGRVVAGGDLKLWVNDRSKVRLVGSARRVLVKTCEGHSTLDLRGFDAEEVIFENALTNNTTVYVTARKIEFTEKIDDKSVAYVRGEHVKGPMVKGNSHVYYSGSAPVFKETDGGGTTEARDW